MFGLDVCGVHSVCSVYEVSGLVVFVAPMGVLGLDPRGVYGINSVYGHWGWMFGASTAFVLLMECLGQTFRLVFYLFFLWHGV